MRASFSLRDASAQARITEVCEQIGLSPSLWSLVLAVRGQHAGFGNRRRMFAAFDALFDDAAATEASQAASESNALSAVEIGGQARVTLTRLVLKNWKVFSHAEFNFPSYDPVKPVVLIGGKNGYGKTSFLEGLRHGLFGQDAAVDLQHALTPGASSLAARAQSYRQALERALHRAGREKSDGVMSVRSEWQTPQGELIVERRWYFDEAGALVVDDEALILWTGPDKEILPVPEGEEPIAFYQAEIARRLMPASLAAFVLFDGEQVKRFAERDFADQVRAAVETVLGLSAWRETIADLRDYARDRSRGAVRNDEQDRASDSALEGLKLAEAAALDAIEALKGEAFPLRTSRDDLLSQIGALGGRTFATMQEMLERRQLLQSEEVRARHEVAALASSELPWLLIGASLRRKLQDALTADRDQSALGLWSEAASLERLMAEVAKDQAGTKNRALIEDVVRRAWTALAGSVGSEATARHAYLSPEARDAALGRLAVQEKATREELVYAAGRFESIQAELVAAAKSIAEREAQDRDAVMLRSKLDEVTGVLAELDDRRRILDQTLGRVQSELLEKTEAAETRLVSRLADAQLVARRRAALDVAHRGEALIEALKPVCFDSVGEAVTEAYRALAHKGLVNKVSIDPDGTVVLMDHRGIDVRAIEASAGESQIFAMALMAAVAELAGYRLPSIIDTPLGRLDPEHRLRVLAFFTSRDVQTILLSQPDEVNARYLQLIDGRISSRFHLSHTLQADGPGASVPVAGYFPEIAA